MAELRFFLDEDIYRATTSSLRKAGYNANSTPESGRLGESDESHLQWASGESRVIVTFNVAHFARLHAEWMKQGRHHAGIITQASSFLLSDPLVISHAVFFIWRLRLMQTQ